MEGGGRGFRGYGVGGLNAASSVTPNPLTPSCGVLVVTTVLTPQYRPGAAAPIEAAVLDYHRAIEDDGLDAARGLVGRARRPVVGDRPGVEHDQIGGQLRRDAAAIVQPHTLGVEAGHAAHGVGQAEQLELAYVPTEQAREGAIRCGVVHPVAGEDRVGLEAAGLVLQDLAQALLLAVAARVVPIHDARLAAQLADQIEIGLRATLSAFLRDLGHRATLVVGQLAL